MFDPGFQSIGVTKDWRPAVAVLMDELGVMFPINRRHQGLATRVGHVDAPGQNC